MSGDLVQGLSSWERILVARECRCRELGNRLPGCTETLTTPAANGGEKEGYRLYCSVPGVFSMDDVLCTGFESYLQACTYNSSDKCESDEGAGVICSN
mgnify:FL=1